MSVCLSPGELSSLRQSIIICPLCPCVCHQESYPLSPSVYRHLSAMSVCLSPGELSSLRQSIIICPLCPCVCHQESYPLSTSVYHHLSAMSVCLSPGELSSLSVSLSSFFRYVRVSVTMRAILSLRQSIVICPLCPCVCHKESYPLSPSVYRHLSAMSVCLSPGELSSLSVSIYRHLSAISSLRQSIMIFSGCHVLPDVLVKISGAAWWPFP